MGISSCIEIAAESNNTNNNLRKQQQQTATIITTTGRVYFWKSFSRFLPHSLSLPLSLSDCLSLMEVIPRLLLFVPRVVFLLSSLSAAQQQQQLLFGLLFLVSCSLPFILLHRKTMSLSLSSSPTSQNVANLPSPPLTKKGQKEGPFEPRVRTGVENEKAWRIIPR